MSDITASKVGMVSVLQDEGRGYFVRLYGVDETGVWTEDTLALTDLELDQLYEALQKIKGEYKYEGEE